MPAATATGGTPTPFVTTVGIRNLGTTTTTAITRAIQWTRPADGSQVQVGNLLAPAAIAQINNAIKWDPSTGAGALGLNTGHGFFPQGQLTPAFNFLGPSGFLEIPGRGKLKLRQGDIIAVDPTTGWPILISAYAIAAPGSIWTLSAVIS